MQTLPAQATETDQRLLKFPDAIAKGFFLPFKALRPQANLAPERFCQLREREWGNKF